MKKEVANQNEAGAIEVEATVIMPLVILSVILLLFVAEMMLERALLQASLQNALTYYSSTLSDSFVSVDEKVIFSAGSSEKESDSGRLGKGNHYEEPNNPLFPYRGVFGNKKEAFDVDFKKFFLSTGTFLFKDNLEVSYSYENKFIYEELTATARQSFKLPIDMSLLGAPNTYSIEASAKVVVVDNDNIIDNIDFVVHLINKTKVGDLLKDIGGKVKEGYDKLHEFLGGD